MSSSGGVVAVCGVEGRRWVMFTAARQREILAQAHANLAKKEDRSSLRQPEIIYKTRDNAAVASAPSERGASAASEWAEWVENRIQARLMEFAEDTGKVTGEWLEEIR